MKPTSLIISCEHGGNEVPPDYRYLFTNEEYTLNTHRGLDIGSYAIAKHLAKTMGCDHVINTVTRLLIDYNRSISHLKCFSEFTKKLSPLDKQKLIDQYYLPYRHQVEKLIQKHINHGQQVLHLSIHTFTPTFNNVIRNAAIGLLYDPKRHGEKEVVREWFDLLFNHPSTYRVRLNYPYRGTSDGFTTALRKKYSETDYLGIEIESNQALVQDETSLKQLLETLSSTLKDLMQLLG